MYRTTGFYLPTHRPLPISEVEHAREAADKDSPPTAMPEPMVFVRLLVVAGLLLAAAFVAASVS
ncbi:hypothetical protein MPL1032_370025 [Mesorhizobium plurifarium]|uniref:Uncharacterized protein n=1 Tax=Mesorhizobium plurifarium TaxID=69974 RepID=A0A0K2W4H1_MESPL|nr:hypothetical protein MPL1032_370025 [Mesorhizobium plurifarium]